MRRGVKDGKGDDLVANLLFDLDRTVVETARVERRVQFDDLAIEGSFDRQGALSAGGNELCGIQPLCYPVGQTAKTTQCAPDKMEVECGGECYDGVKWKDKCPNGCNPVCAVIDGKGSGKARTFRIEVRLEDKSRLWRPGMTGRLRVPGGSLR